MATSRTPRLVPVVLQEGPPTLQERDRLRTGRQELTVKPALLPQEAHLALGVAADETEDHGGLFSALEAVDAAKFDAREALL
jgi:hypothetical protein